MTRLKALGIAATLLLSFAASSNVRADHREPALVVTMARMITRLVGAAVVSAAASQAPAPAPSPSLEAVGPQVGAKVPSFTLPDQSGQPRSLDSLLGPKGAMLVFFRSADW